MVHLAQPVVVLTGAGVSAESSIPTFRGASGLWRNHRATDLATPQAFRRDPKLVWQFYAWRRKIIADAQPNAAHYTIAAMEQTLPDFTLITQNIDGLHELAGSQNILVAEEVACDDLALYSVQKIQPPSGAFAFPPARQAKQCPHAYFSPPSAQFARLPGYCNLSSLTFAAPSNIGQSPSQESLELHCRLAG